MKTVTEHLLALADAGNAAFTARLAPGVDPDRMLGCRIPQLRRLARTLRGTPEAAAFLTQLPHRYYDENNLHGIDEKFDTHHLDRLTALPSGEYYVDMAVAWAFSVALVKHFEQTLPYFTQRRLDRRVHNKALQKGRESLRIDDARKTILQRLKY